MVCRYEKFNFVFCIIVFENAAYNSSTNSPGGES